MSWIVGFFFHIPVRLYCKNTFGLQALGFAITPTLIFYSVLNSWSDVDLNLK